MMKRILIASAVLALSGAAAGQGQQAGSMHPAGSHVVMTPETIKWGPAPPALPAGAEAAILSGDPAVAGESFTIRLKFPDGYKIPAHWHPVDEYVTVLQGTLMIGLGDKFDMAGTKAMPTGTFARMPKETRHYAAAKGETLIQVNAIGPFAVTYVNPADDPRTKKSTD